MLRVSSGALAVALAWLATAAPVAAQSLNCRDLAPGEIPESAAARTLEPIDLVRLRDIGSLPDFINVPIFAISPNRKMVAFQLRQADPESNGHCLGMFVMEPRPGAKPIMIDSGGELIRWRFDNLLGKSDFPTGFAKVITPRWFPDGRSIAFLKRTGSVTQVWRAAIDGGVSTPITRSEIDVGDFRITPDGRAVVYSTSPALRAAREAIAQEGRSGFHYDDRFSPSASDGPFPAPPIATETFVIDVAAGTVRSATAAEATMLSGQEPNTPAGALAFARSGAGRRAWTKATSTDTFPPEAQLVAEDRTGREIACTAEACRGVGQSLWWSLDGQHVRFMRREGWGQSATAIYEWAPGSQAARRLYTTEDMLVDCQPFGDDLICADEGSTTPRRLNLLQPTAGQTTLLFDPNPGFQRLALGRVERLRWKSAFNVESFGDLVYPVGYRPGVRYPLIIVQYATRGFLRGGTGDEYPIQAFANRGYAVLSVQRPRSPARAINPKSYADLDKADLKDFADRRNVLSSIEIAVHDLIDDGLVDRQRIGITGLSDGSSTVQFAGLNSSLFSAAAMSGCCWERSQLGVLGPAIARQYREVGWPSITRDAPDFWSRISWAQNARRVAFPVLMQLSDSEYRSALEAYTALREVGAPIDMYVFPGEPHVKWQPVHKLAVYERNLDWFDFWLRGVIPTAPARAPEVAHWAGMKARSVADSHGASANGHNRR